MLLRFWLHLIIALTLVGSAAGCSRSRPLAPAPEIPAAGLLALRSVSQEPADAPVVLKRRSGQYLMAYHSMRPGQKHIFVQLSQNGIQWEKPVQVTHQSFSSASPQLVEDAAGEVVLFYTSNSSEKWALYRSRSRDGLTWDSPEPVNLPHGQINQVAATFYQGRYTLAYQALFDGLYLTTSADGRRWSDPVLVHESGESPSLVHGPDGACILFEDADEQGWNLFTATSRDLALWSSPRQVTHFPRARWGRVTRQGQEYWLVFSAEGSQGNWDIYISRAQSPGLWQDFQQITHNGLSNTSPYLISLEQQALLVWGISQLGAVQTLVMTQLNLL